MNIFRSIWDLMHPKRIESFEQGDGLAQFKRLYDGVSVERLRDLRNTDGFEDFCAALDGHVNIYAEVLLSSRDDAALHEARGVIIGLRKAALLVDEILQAHERLSSASATGGARERAADDSRRAALFGSPSWQR